MMKNVADNAFIRPDVPTLVAEGAGLAIPEVDMREFDKVCFAVDLVQALGVAVAQVLLVATEGLGVGQVTVKESPEVTVTSADPQEPNTIIIEAKAENLPAGKTHFAIEIYDNEADTSMNVACCTFAYDPHRSFVNLTGKETIVKAWE